MRIIIKRFIFIFFCVLITCGLSGCTKQTIEFYRESQASSLFKNSDNEASKDNLKKSSGVIIYKYNTQKKGQNFKTIDFGPKDINFDLPVKFK